MTDFAKMGGSPRNAGIHAGEDEGKRERDGRPEAAEARGPEAGEGEAAGEAVT